MTFIVEPTRKAKFCGSLFLLFVLHECVEVSLTICMLCSICEVLYRSGQVVSSLSDTQSQQTRPANTLSSHGSSALSLSALIYYSLWMLYVSVGQYRRASIRSVCSRRENVFFRDWIDDFRRPDEFLLKPYVACVLFHVQQRHLLWPFA